MHSVDAAGERAAIRSAMRARRAGLDDDDQGAAAMAVMARLARIAAVRHARVVSGYRAIRGELEIDGPMLFLADQGAVVTTPRVRGDHLEFVRTDESTPTTVGSFGILEPASGDVVAVDAHDLMLCPLVAFDAAGRRLGQGGGYYDRALAGVIRRPLGDRPTLIGVAHSFQQLPEIPAEPWDVPLDAVVTEEGIIEVSAGVADRLT